MDGQWAVQTVVRWVLLMVAQMVEKRESSKEFMSVTLKVSPLVETSVST